MAKVYFCKFVHKSTGKVFFKFGHTSKSDALERFNVKYDERYGDFNISCVASIWGELEWVKGVEHAFKAIYPKNIWLEDYLGEGNWNRLSGITEIVELNEQQYQQAVKAFYNIKDQLNKEKEWHSSQSETVSG